MSIKPQDVVIPNPPPNMVVVSPVATNMFSGYGGQRNQAALTSYTNPPELPDGKYEVAPGEETAGDVVLNTGTYLKTGAEGLRGGNCYWERESDGLVLSWEGPYSFAGSPPVLPWLWPTDSEGPGGLETDSNIGGYFRRDNDQILNGSGGVRMLFTTFSRFTRYIYAHGKAVKAIPFGFVLGTGMVDDLLVVIASGANSDGSLEDSSIRIYYGTLETIAKAGWSTTGEHQLPSLGDPNYKYLPHFSSFFFDSTGLRIIGIHRSVWWDLAPGGSLSMDPLLTEHIIRINLSVSAGGGPEPEKTITVSSLTSEDSPINRFVNGNTTQAKKKVEAVGFRPALIQPAPDVEVVVKWAGDYVCVREITPYNVSNPPSEPDNPYIPGATYTTSVSSDARLAEFEDGIETTSLRQEIRDHIQVYTDGPVFNDGLGTFAESNHYQAFEVMYADVKNGYYIFSKDTGTSTLNTGQTTPHDFVSILEDTMQGLLLTVNTLTDMRPAVNQHIPVSNIGFSFDDSFAGASFGTVGPSASFRYKYSSIQAILDESGYRFISIFLRTRGVAGTPGTLFVTIATTSYNLAVDVETTYNIAPPAFDFQVGLSELNIAGFNFQLLNAVTGTKRPSNIFRI